MNKRLTRDFYTRSTLKVAKQLLGKYLVHNIKGGKLIGEIVETEAYIGPKDKAAHSFGGRKTKRNIAEYLTGGYIYIYLVYGMYWQLNISTNKEGRPECVLIRALKPILFGTSQVPNVGTSQVPNVSNANGPGKLCRWMGFDKSHYGIDMVTSNKVWLEDGEEIESSQVVASKRIGIDYAQEWAEKPWRFYIKNNPFVSKM